MRPPTRTTLLACGCLVAGAALCCREARAPQGRRVEDFITVVGVGQDDSAWQALEAAAAKRKDDFLPLSVRTTAPRVRSTEAQIQLLRSLQREGARGICVQVDDPHALIRELESVRKAGIAVVTLVCPVEAEASFLHSGCSGEEIGVALADLTAEAVGRRGTIAFVEPAAGNPVRQRIRESFVRQIKGYPPIQALPGIEFDGNIAAVQRRVDACAERFPRLAAWVFLDGRLLDGPADAVLRIPPTQSAAPFVAFGATPLVRERLTNGQCFAAVAPDYDQIMARGLELCATMAQGLLVATPTYEAPIRVSRGRE